MDKITIPAHNNRVDKFSRPKKPLVFNDQIIKPS